MLTLVKNEVDEHDLLKKIMKYITHPPENSRVVEFTPYMAGEILSEINTRNRPKKPSAIKDYAADMTNGEWGLTGATIIFSDEGVLRDGQNRLSACVRSGVNFTSHVIFGIDDALFHKMDQGKPRPIGDVLSVAGFSNSTTLGSAIRWAYILESDNPFQRSSLRPSHGLELAKGLYSDISDSMPRARKVYSQFHHPVAQLTALHYIMHKTAPERADEFFDLWASGAQGGKAKPIATLQDTLARMKSQSNGRVHDTVRAIMIIKAWNLFSSGKKGSAKSMNYTAGEDFPVITK
ncbi:MAG: hypothetical protein HOE83_00020 [Alphaproteobacteria bacterium]|jgi:hypothetical protein|nr:hypothetical protein [Alphaproteobacteria bacterium]